MRTRLLLLFAFAAATVLMNVASAGNIAHGVEVVVIDEADEMADMGFLPPVKRLLEQISPDAQHMLFSATLDHGVDEVVNTFLHDPKVHEVDSATAEPDLMTHHVFETTRGDKHELVRMLASGEGRRILFTRTKFQAKKLAKNLTQNGIPAPAGKNCKHFSEKRAIFGEKTAQKWEFCSTR